MRATNPKTDHEWAREQIRAYGQNRRLYTRYAEVLKEVLEKAVSKLAPLAIIQARPKALASFAEKIQRKISKYRKVDATGKPLHPITDLCGARVITLTLPEVKAISRFIEEHFDIDQANSIDLSTRLKTNEFGYLSVHYIVRFRPGVFPTKDIPVKVPSSIVGLDAEIQVKTVLEHAWASVGHDICYKSPFRVPDKWQRELARLAASLEDADEAFLRVQSGLQEYMASYGAYMSGQQMREEIGRLTTVLKVDAQNSDVAHRIAKLSMCLEDWRKAVAVLNPFAGSSNPSLLRDLGVATCKLHRKSLRGAEYQQGQQYLARAIDLDPNDAEAMAALAGTWKELSADKARELYQRAFEINPSDPYALGNFLETEIEHRRDLSPVSLAIPNLRRAIRKCRDQADVGMNLPWAFWDMGKFHTLLKQPYLGLNLYAKAVSVSSAGWMIDTSLQSVLRLGRLNEALPELEWVRRFLLVAAAARNPATKLPAALRKLVMKSSAPLRPPIVIVAGGCDGEMTQNRCLMLEAFRDFTGTLISGGTTTGISRLVGDVGARYWGRIHTIGYVPQRISSDVAVDRNKRRYREIRRSDGSDFSPLEPIQGWADILASRIPISGIKLLGINGGDIAAAEYRMALALGACVGVVNGSGGATDELLRDKDWSSAPNLISLPNDPMTVRLFVGPGIPKLEPRLRESLGQAIHEAYRRAQLQSGISTGISLAPWNKLPDDLKESNRQQADQISDKLQAIGADIRDAKRSNPVLIRFTKNEIEALAEMEHARWNVERLLAGWKYAETKDVDRKFSPYLVSWANLSDEIKELDRNTVRAIPELLAQTRLEIFRRV